MRTRAALAAIAMLLAACESSAGACVTHYTGRAGTATTPACRQDLERAACARESATSSFTPGRGCADVGFPCLHTQWGAVLFEARDPSGACPPGTSAP